MADRDRDIDILDIKRENKRLFDDWLRDKLGSRVKRVMPEIALDADLTEDIPPEEGFYGG